MGAGMGRQGHVRYTTNTWCGRMCNSLVGALFGVVLFLGSFPLLIWNEGAAVQTAQSLDEGMAQVVEVALPPGSYPRHDPALDGRLVHIAAEAHDLPTLRDDDFGVAVKALQLRRQVDMYQWREHERRHKRKDSFGNEHVETEYTYSAEWADSPISSSRFDDPSYRNPGAMEARSAVSTADSVHLGDYVVRKPLISQLAAGDGERPLELSMADRSRRGSLDSVSQTVRARRIASTERSLLRPALTCLTC